MRIPLNRAVAFFGPVISLVSGAAAAWLVAKVNILGIPGLGLDENELGSEIAGALTLTLTAALLHLGQSAWLRGHHIELANDGSATVAAIKSTAKPAGEEGDVLDPDLDGDTIDVGNLPSDAEEFAAPPPDPPVQPSQAGLVATDQ